ncbi:hypothetical protein LCGC14_1590220, partial [marine sediment metagenome]
RIKGLSDRIIKYYEDMLTIDDDEDKVGTVAFYTAWKDVSIQYLGRSTSIEEARLYVHFIYGRRAADKEKAEYKDWIASIYEKWPNSAPELSQLYGDNAALAYNKFIGVKSRKYDTKSEQEYFEKGSVKVKKIVRKRSTNKKGVLHKPTDLKVLLQLLRKQNSLLIHQCLPRS